MTRPEVGDRVRVTGILPNDPDPLEIGEEGTVDWVTPEDWTIQQYGVKWDSGRSLNLLPQDPFIILSWSIDGPVIGPCEECGAVGDVECEPHCENKDFRDAEFDGVLEPEEL